MAGRTSVPNILTGSLIIPNNQVAAFRRDDQRTYAQLGISPGSNRTEVRLWVGTVPPADTEEWIRIEKGGEEFLLPDGLVGPVFIWCGDTGQTATITWLSAVKEDPELLTLPITSINF